jgi:ElaB/YqjD/DUF883 family membrane-anchored ribosome-binding protein
LIQKHLKRGKIKLIRLERELTSGNRRQKLKAEFEKMKVTLVKLKNKFAHYEKMAVQYTQQNPKKALALASAAGILAGSLWSSFRTRRTPSSTARIHREKINKTK